MTMPAINLSRLTVVALVVWICLLLYTSTVLVRVHQTSKNTGDGSENEGGGKSRSSNDNNIAGENAAASDRQITERLSRAMDNIELLKKENEQLQILIRGQNLSVQHNGRRPTKFSKASVIFTKERETLRRSLENGLVELWYAASSKLRALKERLKDSASEATAVDRLSAELQEQHRIVLADALKLADADGLDEQRRRQLWNLTQMIQSRIAYLQNPADCDKAKKLVCQLNKGCGFGCQLHHVVYCLIVAYGTQRTMILDSRGWRYSQRGWSSVFMPASDTCVDEGHASAEPWQSEEQQRHVQVVSLPIVDSLHLRPSYLPLSFPEDIADQLLTLHGNPPVWWIGQFVWYLMRYNNEFVKELNSIGERLKFDTPCVGLHVRRTDKVGSEAAFHALEEYMQFAEAWYRVQAVKNGTSYDSMTKRIYIATDEPALIGEAQKKYKAFTIIGDSEISNTAQLNNRYTDASLRGVIADIHFLSRCDYLVCTFSSQVCRIAYEIMQVIRGDAAAGFYSLDDVYYFGGQDGHEQIAILSHKASGPKEIDLEPGDVIGIAGNHWDGYSKGRNERTGQTGLYPSYKVKEKWRIVKFPVYPSRPEKRHR